MTDRYNALVVALGQDTRADDCKELASAIKQMRGVVGVDGHMADIHCHVATTRVRTELLLRIVALLNDGGEITWRVP